MASYHLTVKAGARGKAAAHAAYIVREGKYSGRDRYEDLEATASGNLPEWAAHNAAHSGKQPMNTSGQTARPTGKLRLLYHVN